MLLVGKGVCGSSGVAAGGRLTTEPCRARYSRTMCHTDVAPGQVAPPADSAQVSVPLADGANMPASLTTAGPARGSILLISDMWGPTPFYEHLAALLADAGFEVLLPDLFFRQGALPARDPQLAFARRAQLDERQTVSELALALDWLTARGDRARIGILGFCMGGTFALDLASQRDDAVTVSYYGFPAPQATLPKPPPAPLELVDRLRGPVLAFWGEDDKFVGLEPVHEYAARAADANPEFSYEIVPGAGHGFLAQAKLDSEGDVGGATWARTIAHFRANLC